MKKTLALFIIFSYTSMLFGAYDIKIGAYKNVKNLRANIAKIKNTKYTKYIIIEKKSKLHYAHAVIKSNVEAKKALSAYKRVFKDAFISKRQVKIKKIEQKIFRTLIQKVNLKKNVQNINAKDVLAQKTIYVCYEKGPKHLKERVVEMVFAKEYVTYSPLVKMVTSPVNMPYIFENNTLTLQLSNMKITHRFSKKTPDFLYAQSIIDGLVVNKLRYYFDKNHALAFVKNN